jgi:hypothetical protein
MSQHTPLVAIGDVDAVIDATSAAVFGPLVSCFSCQTDVDRVIPFRHYWHPVVNAA